MGPFPGQAGGGLTGYNRAARTLGRLSRFSYLDRNTMEWLGGA